MWEKQKKHLKLEKVNIKNKNNQLFLNTCNKIIATLIGKRVSFIKIVKMPFGLQYFDKMAVTFF